MSNNNEKNIGSAAPEKEVTTAGTATGNAGGIATTGDNTGGSGSAPVGGTTAAPASKPAPEPAVPEGMVMVSKEDLSAVLEEVRGLKETVKQQESLIFATADKARLAQYEKLNDSGELIRKVKVRKWQGAPVIGWATVKDEVGVIEGKLVAEQIIRIFTDNGDKEPATHDVQYLDFARQAVYEDAEIMETSKGRTGESFTVRFEDGRTLKIDTRFVN